MLKFFMCAAFVALSVHIVHAQWPYYQSQYPYYNNNNNNPTFSNLYSQSATQSPYSSYYAYPSYSGYSGNSGNSGNSGASVRIWPYVVDQYLYPGYNTNYNTNNNNPYASNSNYNWQNGYTQSQWGK